MFHLLIGAAALGMFWAFLAVLAIPLWLGPLAQFLVSLIARGRVARWIPAALGLLGLVWSGWTLGIREAWYPLWGIAAYWAVYGLLLWAADALSQWLRAWLRGKGKPGGGPL